MEDRQHTIVRTYRGTEAQAIAAFQTDAVKMGALGYYPTTQAWAAGTYGCGAFLGALLLCFLLVGVLIFVYMLIVKPPGTLTVTYGLREREGVGNAAAMTDEKMCPRCAERVKAAALVCRYCGHEFSVN